jgi:hypothetical protein
LKLTRAVADVLSSFDGSGHVRWTRLAGELAHLILVEPIRTLAALGAIEVLANAANLCPRNDQ